MASPFEIEMGVLPEIAKAVKEMEWNLPTDVQGDAIPLILGGGDVLMAAETGSGKTGAFCLPVLQIVYETLNADSSSELMMSGKTMQLDDSWNMNLYDSTPSMAIDTNTMICQSRDLHGWHGCRANKGVKGAGRHYFECTVTDGTGLCRVGWSTLAANLDLGKCRFGFGYGGTGRKSNNNQFAHYGGSFTRNDTIGNCLDLDKGLIRWYKNGEDLGLAFTLSKALKPETFYPTVAMKNAELRFNFGAQPMTKVPAGYKCLCDAPTRNVVISKRVPKKRPAACLEERKGPLAIIIEPSLELAEQTFRQLQLFQRHLTPAVFVSLLIGGVDTEIQQQELAQVVDIVVGTPGRLQDMIDAKFLCLDRVRFFVLDECDGLLSQGHQVLIENIHRLLPKMSVGGSRLQIIVCSATLHSLEVKKLADTLMRFPQWVDLKGEDSVPDTVHHMVCVVDPHTDKSWQQGLCEAGRTYLDGVHSNDRLSATMESPEIMSEAVKILKQNYVITLIRSLQIDRAFIFCRTKNDCDNLEHVFVGLGGGPNESKHQFSCVCLHGDRKANERTANLNKFKEGGVRFLICTDIAARGIDIKELPCVINVMLPDVKENYVHRIGRVGRADRMGLAISLVASVKEKVWYHTNCKRRGKGCVNTKLVIEGGCCVWYTEMKLLGEVEEHLGVTIEHIGRDFQIGADTFDGDVVYGAKRARNHVTNDTMHREMLSPAIKELMNLELVCSRNYLNMVNRL